MPITDYNKKKQLEVTTQNDSGTTQDKAQPVIISGGQSIKDGAESGSSEIGWESNSNTTIDANSEIEGTYSVELASSNSSESNQKSLPEELSPSTNFEIKIKFDNNVTNVTDSISIQPQASNGSNIVNINVRNGIEVGGTEIISSISANTVYEIEIELFYQKGTCNVTINNTQESGVSLDSNYQVSDGFISQIELGNNTIGSGDTRSLFIDDYTYQSSDDSTTGTGDIVVDFTNISDAQDIAVYDQNGNLLDYEIESLDTTAETGVLWCYNSWVRDGSTQAQVAYGSNSANVDRQNVTGTWNNTGQNAVMVQHLQDDPLTATDSTSNNNDGSVTGVSSVSNAQFNGGASFDGSDDYISVSSSTSVNLSTFSIEMWIKTTDTTGDGSPSYFGGLKLFEKDVPGTGGDDWSLLLNDGQVILVVGNSSTNNDQNLVGSNIADGNWHQIIATRDQSTGDVAIYIDGSLDVSDTLNTNDLTNSQNIGIGSFSDGSGTYYQGDMDEIRLDNTVVSSDWIQAEYDASPKAGQVFFSQQAAEDTAVTQSGVANGSASLDGDATATNRLSGVAPANATLNGDATATQTINIRAQATGNASLTGSGDMYKRVSVTSNGSAALNGDAAASLGAIVSARATGTASLTSTGTATKIVQPVATGNASLDGEASGSLLVKVSADGDASLTTSAVGTTTELAQAVATGTASLTGSAIGSVPLTFRDSEITASIDKTTEKTLKGDIDK